MVLGLATILGFGLWRWYVTSSNAAAATACGSPAPNPATHRPDPPTHCQPQNMSESNRFDTAASCPPHYGHVPTPRLHESEDTPDLPTPHSPQHRAPDPLHHTPFEPLQHTSSEPLQHAPFEPLHPTAADVATPGRPEHSSRPVAVTISPAKIRPVATVQPQRGKKNPSHRDYFMVCCGSK